MFFFAEYLNKALKRILEAVLGFRGGQHRNIRLGADDQFQLRNDIGDDLGDIPQSFFDVGFPIG
jgi:hypothetical protein